VTARSHRVQGGDVTSTSRVCVAIIALCFNYKEYKLLNENLVLISKRRGQLKTVHRRV
jgi:26S proteasome regulatory subunit N5